MDSYKFIMSVINICICSCFVFSRFLSRIVLFMHIYVGSCNTCLLIEVTNFVLDNECHYGVARIIISFVRYTYIYESKQARLLDNTSPYPFTVIKLP